MGLRTAQDRLRTCRRFPNLKKRRKQNIITTRLCEGLDKEVYTQRRSARSHAVYTFVPLSLFQERTFFVSCGALSVALPAESLLGNGHGRFLS